MYHGLALVLSAFSSMDLNNSSTFFTLYSRPLRSCLHFSVPGPCLVSTFSIFPPFLSSSLRQIDYGCLKHSVVILSRPFPACSHAHPLGVLAPLMKTFVPGLVGYIVSLVKYIVGFVQYIFSFVRYSISLDQFIVNLF